MHPSWSSCKRKSERTKEEKEAFKNLFQLKKYLLAYHSHSFTHELTIPSMKTSVTV